MALDLFETPAAANANSYASVDEAVEYAQYRVGGAAFVALATSDEDKFIQTLVTATREIDTLEDVPGFAGSRYTTTQALAFPRGAATLPASLVRATIELAMTYTAAVVDGTTDVLADASNGNIKEDTVGPITTIYFEKGTPAATAFERFPPVVQRLLYALTLVPTVAGWGSATVSRGS